MPRAAILPRRSWRVKASPWHHSPVRDSLRNDRSLLPPLAGCGTAALVQVCVVMLVLTVAFETTLGLIVNHTSGRALLDHYALWRGELRLLVLAVLTVTPFIWGRWWPVE